MLSDTVCAGEKDLSPADRLRLSQQNSRLVPAFKAKMLEIEAKKHWDLFYKRNETRFFKDRHWTTREFVELLGDSADHQTAPKILLEIGCGVGNLVYPLIEEKRNFFVYACDFSARAIELVKTNKLYDESVMCAFQNDITTTDIFGVVKENRVDVVTLIFVLSAIHPDKFAVVVENVYKLLKPGGVILFRDYGLYDMAQLRFKAGHKIAENLYMRQDGTRSYYFSTEELSKIFQNVGFDLITNSYVHRRTINKKEDIDVPRIFVQAKFRKPDADTMR